MGSFLILLLTLLLTSNNVEGGVLFSFENPDEVNEWLGKRGASISQSSIYATEGKSSAIITFPKGIDYPTVSFSPVQRDWSGFSKFSFNLYNPNEENLRLTVSFSDKQEGESGRQTRHFWLELPKGMHSVGIPVYQIEKRHDAPNLEISIKDIDSVDFLIDKVDKNTIFYLDNVRLVPIFKPNPLPEISLFEDEKDVDKWKYNAASLTRSMEWSSQGKYSCKVTFHPFYIYPHIYINYLDGDYASCDWSSYDRLLMDVYNPSDEEAPFSVEIRSDDRPYAPAAGEHKLRSFSYGIPPNSQKEIEIPVSEIEKRTGEQDLALKNISSLLIVSKQPESGGKDKVLYIDNIRLTSPAQRLIGKEDESPYLSGIWHFDEGKGGIILDTTVNKNDGKVSGARWVKGKFGNALEFAGNDSVEFPDSESLKPDEFTIEFWAKPISQKFDYAGWLWKAHTVDKVSYGWRLVWASIGANRVYMAIYDGEGGPESTGGTELIMNEWVHLAFVVGDGVIKCYKNGILQPKAWNGDYTRFVPSSASLGIGGGFNGIIDELKIYNKPLSMDEVQEHYTAAGGVIKEVVPTPTLTKKVEPIKTYEPHTLPEISYFEIEDDIERWERVNTDMELSSEHVSHGKHSAKITFNAKDARIHLRDGVGGFIKDWSNYGTLAFDIYNPNSFTVMFLMTIDSHKEGGLSFEHFSVPAGSKKTIRKSLLLPMIFFRAENLWAVGEISSINFFITTNPTPGEPYYNLDISKEGVTLYFDNMRLVSREETLAHLNFPNCIDETATELKVGKSDVGQEPLSYEALGRFKGLKVFWMNSKEVITDREEFSKNYATLTIIAENKLDYYIGSPSSLEQLKKYDIVVFDDGTGGVFTQEQLGWVKKFYEQGGALMILGGWGSFGGIEARSSFRGTPIEDIIPVKLSGSPDDSRVQPKSKLEKPEHPVMKGIPWETKPTSTYNVVTPKQDSEILAVDGNTGRPIAVLGPRSLAYTEADCWGGAALLNWKPWERFIIQAFNYMTKDKVIDKVVITGIDLISPAGIGSDAIGKVHLINLGDRKHTISVKLELSKIGSTNVLLIKEIKGLNLGPRENKEIDFSFAIPHQFTEGEYELSGGLEDSTVDSISQKIVLKPLVYVELDVPHLPHYEEGEVSYRVKVYNLSNEDKKVHLSARLERNGKPVKEPVREEIVIEVGKTKDIKYKLDLKGIKKGEYHILTSVTDGERIIDEEKVDLRIYTKEGDFSFVFWSRGDYFPSSHEAISPLFEKLDFFRLGYGPVVDMALWRFFPGVSRLGEDIKIKPYLAPHYKELAERQIPFLLHLGTPWGGTEATDVYFGKANAIVKWANEMGGEYFLGVIWFEVDGATHSFKAICDKEKRLDRADAYTDLINEYKRRIGLPPGKKLILVQSNMFAHGMSYEAGADIVFQETPEGRVENFPMELSQIRGMGRSFRKPWGLAIYTDDILLSHVSGVFHYDIKTGRYDPQMKKDEPRQWDWKIDTDIYKMYIEKYYSGANYLWPAYERPLTNQTLGEGGKMILKFLEFIDNNPRGKDVIAKVAVLRSKGDGWDGTICYHDESDNGNVQGFGGPWFIGGKHRKEEADYIYLNSFFPDFSDDAIFSKHFWTGTPYGAVDIIYPKMTLEDMKRYNCIIFMGYHRMDSARKDFLDDLMKYVEDGGIILISADQLKDRQDKFNVERLVKFTGVKMTDTRYNLGGAINVLDSTVIGLTTKTYDTSSGINLYEEKKTWGYKIELTDAKPVAKDSEGNVVLSANKYGKGYVFLLSTPTLSMLPPSGKNGLVKDVIDKIAKYKGLPVTISPDNDKIEYLLSMNGKDEAVIFIMNHGPEIWQGDVILNLTQSGLNNNIGTKAAAKVAKGYEIKELHPEVKKEGNSLIIKGITLQGDEGDFYAYRSASFALVRVR